MSFAIGIAIDMPRRTGGRSLRVSLTVTDWERVNVVQCETSSTVNVLHAESLEWANLIGNV